ncbi:MAG: HAMP domain-containing sensor histidine kinase [Pseudomonadota bacterium]
MMIQSRMLMSSAVLLVLLVSATGIMFWTYDQTRRTHALISDAYTELLAHTSLSKHFLEIDRGVEAALDKGLRALPPHLFTTMEEVVDAMARDRERHALLTGGVAQLAEFDVPLEPLPLRVAEDVEDLARRLTAFDTALRTRAPAQHLQAQRIQIRDRIRNRIDPALTAYGLQYQRTFLALIEQNDRLHRFNAILLGAFSIVAVIVGMVVLAFSVERMRAGLSQLSSGAARFAHGDLTHRIKCEGQDEFTQLAEQFNAMATEIQSDRHLRERHRRSLEDSVIERTTELKEANIELLERERQRRIFFADLGHELRTPLTVMRGEAEIALRARRDREAAYGAALTRVVDISDQLTRLVNDIFLLARAQSGMLDLRERPLDLAAVVRASSAEMTNWVEKNGGRIHLSLPDDPAIIEGDETRLMQVLRILVTNAAQHGGERPVITVALERDGSQWRLSVTDTGPGIPMEEREQVFTRFYKGGGERVGGTGLGLPIARTLVQAHGGRIWIDGAAGSGATFRLTFPMADAAPVARAALSA